MKAIKLTSHTASMHLVIQFSGDRVVPRERFGPIPQLFMGAASKQRTEQLMAHRQVVENLQHVNENNDRHGIQNNRLERVTKVARVNHLDSATLIKLE